MGKTAIEKYNGLWVYPQMVYAFHLSGCRLLTFAYIHGFCKDEVGICYSSINTISQKVGYAPRTVAEAIKNLNADGFIYKCGTTTIGGQQVNGYRTFFFELMDRYDAGEEIKPALLRSRRGFQKEGYAQCAVLHQNGENDAQCAVEVMHNVQKGYAQCAPYNKRIIKGIIKDCCSNTRERAIGEQWEQQQFYLKFFFRNAAKPQEELAEFIRYNTTLGWKTKDGSASFDTFEKRMALAEGWHFEKGSNRTDGKFLAALEQIFLAALEAGDESAAVLIDTKLTGGLYVSGGLLIHCTKTQREWIESHSSITKDPLMGLGYGDSIWYDVKPTDNE